MSAKPNVADIIRAYNAGREPERLTMKLATMRATPFGFLRGSAHLYWQRVLQAGVAATAPPAWCSGDQHLENFGTYRGDNGLVYFDLNDFDEAALAPCDWEILRLLTSILIAAPSLHLTKADARELAKLVANAYRHELTIGKARWIERKTATGAIDTLMAALKKRRQTRLLDRRTVLKKGQRHLDPDSTRMLPVADPDRAALQRFATALAKTHGADNYFTLIDAARRIAGTGSLGMSRFVLLLEGTGSPEGNVLLDLKAASASSMVGIPGIVQPKWSNDAERIVAIQQRCQAIAPGQLRAVPFEGKAYVLKELQPDADRLNLARIAADREQLADAFQTMGHLVAWAQLRSSGRDGSAPADGLISFAKGEPGMATRLVGTARDMAAIVLEDYHAFCEEADVTARK